MIGKKEREKYRNKIPPLSIRIDHLPTGWIPGIYDPDTPGRHDSNINI